MKLEHVLAISLGAALALVACFPDISYREDPGGGGSGNAGGNGGDTGGSGGTGGVITTSSGGGGSAPTCTPGDLGTCGNDMKCTVLDPSSGAIGCGQAGPLGRWQRCDGDADCADGLWCDLVLGACKPFCTNLSNCQLDGFNGTCVPLQRTNGSAMPGGTKACRSNCNPKTGLPCDTSDLTCVYVVTDTRFDCAKTKKYTEDTDCVSSMDCGVGMLCAETSTPNEYTCRNWCTSSLDDCTFSNPVCFSINPQISWEGTPMGVCSI